MPAPAGKVYEVASRFRSASLARERGAASEMVRHYGEAWRTIRGEIEALATRYYDALGKGEEPQLSWLYERDRLTALQAQVEREIAAFADHAERTITTQEFEAVQAGQRYARESVDAAVPSRMAYSWSTLPTEAVTDLIGFTQDGSPLRKLLDELGPAASQAVAKGLITGLAMGANPRETARIIQKDMGGNLVRALTISRTETLRALRESTLRSYEENDDVVEGWEWVASKSGRTCASCLAMDGTRHKMSERLDDHPNGRCVAVPVVRGVEREPRETGEEWFDKQDAAVKEQVLGSQAALQAYQRMDIDLRDMVARSTSKAWGTTRSRSGLAQALQRSGMPQVGLVVHPLYFDPPQSLNDVRRAIRELRDRVGSLRGMRIGVETIYTGRQIPTGVPGQTVTAPFGSTDPATLRIDFLNNKLAWPYDVQDTLEYIRQWEDAQLASTGRAVVVRARLPKNEAEFAVATLKHEYGHVLTVRKVGNYHPHHNPTFDWASHLPAPLLADIKARLQVAGVADDTYNIGEVIADDVRRYLSGRDSYPNYMMRKADLADLNGAWQRARTIWRWLNR